jgi:hypothetical protein
MTEGGNGGMKGSFLKNFTLYKSNICCFYQGCATTNLMVKNKNLPENPYNQAFFEGAILSCDWSITCLVR